MIELILPSCGLSAEAIQDITSACAKLLPAIDLSQLDSLIAKLDQAYAEALPRNYAAELALVKQEVLKITWVAEKIAAQQQEAENQIRISRAALNAAEQLELLADVKTQLQTERDQAAAPKYKEHNALSHFTEKTRASAKEELEKVDSVAIPVPAAALQLKRISTTSSYAEEVGQAVASARLDVQKAYSCAPEDIHTIWYADTRSRIVLQQAVGKQVGQLLRSTRVEDRDVVVYFGPEVAKAGESTDKSRADSMN